jgi:tetratricopeptide (TPR) repeat protein
MSWRGWAVDYVFEDNELASIHRMGLSVHFGATVEERRLAAIREAEEALQARLAEEYDRRQSERTDELFAEVETARGEGRHDDALEILAVITTLTPGTEKARQMQLLCWSEKASELERAGKYTEAALAYGRALAVAPEDVDASEGIARCRAEGDRRAARSARVRQRFADALDAFGAGDLVAARRGFSAVLAIDSQDEDATAMLQRTEEAIDHRVAEQLDSAKRYARGSLFREAAAAVEGVRSLDPAANGLVEAEELLARLEREASRRAAVAAASEATGPEDQATVESATPQAPPPVSTTPQEKRQAEDLYKQGVEAMESNRPQDAVRYWELALSTDPAHLQAKEHLKREYLMGGMDLFAVGRLDEAVTYWEKALQVDPADQKAKGYLARAQQQLSRTREILGSGR